MFYPYLSRRASRGPKRRMLSICSSVERSSKGVKRNNGRTCSRLSLRHLLLRSAASMQPSWMAFLAPPMHSSHSPITSIEPGRVVSDTSLHHLAVSWTPNASRLLMNTRWSSHTPTSGCSIIRIATPSRTIWECRILLIKQ